VATGDAISILAIYFIILGVTALMWTQRSLLLSVVGFISCIFFLAPLFDLGVYYGIPVLLIMIALILKTLFRAWTSDKGMDL
jgi:nitrogen fixation-related uncharacterized protein